MRIARGSFIRVVCMTGSALSLAQFSIAQPTPPYRNPKLSVELRVQDLLKRMTVQEKIAQLRCDGNPNVYGPALKTTGFGELSPILRGMSPAQAAMTANRLQAEAAQSRLGIPLIIHDEALHGLVGNEATSFPQAVGMAATWNPKLVNQVAKIIAEETKSRGIRHVLSPVLNVVRDARWGRVEETYGEDTLLNTRMGVEFIKGFEQNGVITTPKHYVANVWDGGRDSHSVNVSERQLREIYFPPFKAAFQEGGARSVMPAYGSLNGLACSANPWLLTDVLRKEWGFKGFVVSDYGSVGGVMWAHRTAANAKETAAQTINAGMDMELPDVNIFGQGLEEAVAENLISTSTLDRAVGRVLRVKFELGLFEGTEVDPTKATEINGSRKNRDLALEMARQSLVLLKNDGKTLPLKKDIRKIAVMGPHAMTMPLGGYSGAPKQTVSLLQGLRDRLGADRVVYTKGCDLSSTGALPPIPSKSLRPLGDKPTSTGLTAEYFSNPTLSGTPVLTRIDQEVAFNWDQGSPDYRVPGDGFSVRWQGTLVAEKSGMYRIGVTSDDGARLYLNGKLVAENWTEHPAASFEHTTALRAGEPVSIKLEYFEVKGFASCQLGWVLVGEGGPDPEIAEAVRLAGEADAVVVVAGILEGEARDRAYLDLPGRQEELIKAVAATGKPVIVVVLAGAPVTMEAWLDDADAILDAWYPGQEGGTAIAEALFGATNPGGKLPMTFPRTVGQCPIYYNLEPSGRGYDYVDSTGSPRFAFGFGLSYTTFTYSNLRITPDKGGPRARYEVSFDLTNSGEVAGDEVAQLYTHDVVASQVRPLKELKAFERVTLQPGETKRVVFSLGPDDLSFLDVKLKPVVEPGTIEVIVVGASDAISLKGKIEILRT